jgi:hypothetical protein
MFQQISTGSLETKDFDSIISKFLALIKIGRLVLCGSLGPRLGRQRLPHHHGPVSEVKLHRR